MKKLLSILLVVLCTLCLVGCGEKVEKVDRVIYGNIYTADENNKYAEAIAITGEKFVYVGDADGVKKYIGENTIVETYDNGELITPALVDGHTHVNELMVNKLNQLCEIQAESDKDSIIEQIKAFVEANPDKEFYTVTGWDGSAFLGEEYKIPTWHLLEGITDKPMLCSSSDGHTYWVNKVLLDMSGVTKDTPDPEGGSIAKDPVTGEPLGQFTDTAQSFIQKCRPEMKAEVYYEGIKEADNTCIAQGYLNRFMAMDNHKEDAYNYTLLIHEEELDQSGELKCYEQGSFVVQNVPEVLDQIDEAIKLRDETAGGMYEMTTVKFFTDGIIENAGAYLLEPYSYVPDESWENWYGTPLWSGDESTQRMGEAIAKANQNGMTCHFHCMGDAAVNQVLDAIDIAASIVGEETVRENRNAIAHLALVNENDSARFAKYNVIAVLNPWCAKDPKYYEIQVALLGEDRASNQYPMQSFIEAGVNVSFGSDLGASFTFDCVECFHVLTTRTFNNDDPNSLLNGSEKLTREQALNAMTIGGAYQMKREDTFGSITVGKDASLCVFSKDLLTIEDTEIMSTKLSGSMFRGIWN